FGSDQSGPLLGGSTAAAAGWSALALSGSFGSLLADRAPAGSPVAGLQMGCRAPCWREHLIIRSQGSPGAVILPDGTRRSCCGCCSLETTGLRMCDTRLHGASECADWRADDVGGVVPGQCSRPVPALTCVAGNCGVRSSGKKPKRVPFHPGAQARGRPDGRTKGTPPEFPVPHSPGRWEENG